MEMDMYKTIKMQLDNKIDDLNKVINIIESDMSEYSKAYDICKIYSSSRVFKKEYQFMLDLDNDDPVYGEYITKIRFIYGKFREYENAGIMEDVNFLNKREIMLYNYEYAKFLIESYIERDDSYLIVEFFEDMGINQDVMDFCVKTIKELDVSLYDKYIAKRYDNINKNYISSINNLIDIVNGIKTGYTLSGNEFDIFEFWKKVPFRYFDVYRKEYNEFMEINSNMKPATGFVDRLLSFSKVIVPDDYMLIKEFIISNKIRYASYTDYDKLKRNYSTIKVCTEDKETGMINEVLFNDEIIEKICLYMKENKLPFLVQIFNVVKNMYIDGMIDISKINNDKGLKKTLIP